VSKTFKEFPKEISCLHSYDLRFKSPFFPIDEYNVEIKCNSHGKLYTFDYYRGIKEGSNREVSVDVRFSLKLTFSL
jgi:hypothetical protein